MPSPYSPKDPDRDRDRADGEAEIERTFLASPETAKEAYSVLKQYIDLRDHLSKRAETEHGAKLLFSVNEIAGACNWIGKTLEASLNAIACALSTPDHPSIDSRHRVLPFSRSWEYESDQLEMLEDYVWRFNYEVILERFVDQLSKIGPEQRTKDGVRKRTLLEVFNGWRASDEALLDLVKDPHEKWRKDIRMGVSLNSFSHDYSLRAASNVKALLQCSPELIGTETDWVKQHALLTDYYRGIVNSDLAVLLTQGFEKGLPDEIWMVTRPVDIVRDLIKRDPQALENVDNRRLLAAITIEYYAEGSDVSAEEKITTVIKDLERQIEKLRVRAKEIEAPVERVGRSAEVLESLRVGTLDQIEDSVKMRAALIQVISKERTWLKPYLEN